MTDCTLKLRAEIQSSLPSLPGVLSQQQWQQAMSALSGIWSVAGEQIKEARKPDTKGEDHKVEGKLGPTVSLSARGLNSLR